MTADGYARLEEDLRHLKGVARPEVIRAIAEAREHGDISENAEYHAARERQSFIEGRLAELEDKISRAEIIDPADDQLLDPGLKRTVVFSVLLPLLPPTTRRLPLARSVAVC